MMEKKKLCKLLNGKWNDELRGCELLLKNIEISEGTLNIVFDKGTISTYSWDSEAELPNFLNVEIHSPQEQKLFSQMHKAPLRSPQRAKLIEKLKKYRLDL